MSIRRRPYPEVLDNLLTSITRGVSAESYPFPPPDADSPPFRQSLEQPPVADIISIYGSRNGEPHLFRKNTDYVLQNDRQSLEWLESAELPDPGTLFQVNYYPESAQPIITDIQTGSVVRTLTESVALEIARLYAQLEAVYKSAFIDTATNGSLDNVVALLGIKRITGGRPAGEIEFNRAPGSAGNITIPAGTRILTEDGEVEYETTETVTMIQGQNTIRVIARDLEQSNDPLPADALTILAKPLAGIDGANNPSPTAIATENENDRQLRARAVNFLHGSERATLGAIKEAVARQQVTADIEEFESDPGKIRVTLHAEAISPELLQRVENAIDDTRPAGVFREILAGEPPRKINLQLRITTVRGLLEQDLRAAQRAAREAIEEYFAKLTVGEDGSINRIIGLVLAVPEIEDVRITNAVVDGSGEDILDRDAGILKLAGFPTVLGELDISDPALPTLLNVTVTFPKDPGNAGVPDAVEIQSVLTNALAYLNEVNNSELLPGATNAEKQKRQISFGKLLHVIPLGESKAGESLQVYDEAVAAGTPPALPDEDSILPFKVQFAITQESSLSRILSQASDEVYELTPFERLSLNAVEIQVEPA